MSNQWLGRGLGGAANNLYDPNYNSSLLSPREGGDQGAHLGGHGKSCTVKQEGHFDGSSNVEECAAGAAGAFAVSIDIGLPTRGGDSSYLKKLGVRRAAGCKPRRRWRSS